MAMSRLPDRQDGSRTRRYIVASMAFLILSLAATQIFLNITSVGSPRFIGMTFLVWTATFVVVLAILILATVLGRNLIKLYFERKSGLLGSGFKTKMVSTFIVLSFLPALLLFLLAYTLISTSIEHWFRAPNAQLMENSRILAEQYEAEAEQRSKYFASRIAGYFQSPGDMNASSEVRQRLLDLSREFALDRVLIFDRRARPVADAGSAVSTSRHQQAVRDLVDQALAGREVYHVDRLTPLDPLTEVTWASSPIRDSSSAVIGAVLTETIRPHSARFRVDSVLEAYEKYGQLQQETATFRFNTLMMLVLATLLIIFAFSWFGLYLAKRITVPIEALARGAAAVAAGNLNHRVQCQAFDELGSLVASFNRMIGDLQENEKRIEAAQKSLQKTSAENADRRRYIETILQTIGTGVISLDQKHRIQTMNRAAIDMLQAGDITGEVGLDQIMPPPASDTLRALLQKSNVLGTAVRNIELALPGKNLQLAATATPLVDNNGRRAGWVVVLDDMTELLRMEKMAAWQEVARRLAHEIKNPLTPIQLSAERILRRYRQIMPLQSDVPELWREELERFDKVVAECVQVIIEEAGSLKNLVDEFSRFSRLPEIRVENADINRILDNTLTLYDGRITGIEVKKEFDRTIPPLRLDPEQIKRVFINLFDNALEAMADNQGERALHLRTCCNQRENSVRVEVGDTGCGFPEEYQDSVFLPYFSTRKGGTGLGLAIVRQIVSDHHGTVRAESNKPAGTRIIIELPLA